MSHLESLVPALSTLPIVVRDKDARETAAGCRDRATADSARALVMDTVNGRHIFERSAANWTKRAEMLQRIEAGVEARRDKLDDEACELTQAEAAEDLIFETRQKQLGGAHD